MSDESVRTRLSHYARWRPSGRVQLFAAGLAEVLGRCGLRWCAHACKSLCSQPLTRSEVNRSARPGSQNRSSTREEGGNGRYCPACPALSMVARVPISTAGASWLLLLYFARQSRRPGCVPGRRSSQSPRLGHLVFGESSEGSWWLCDVKGTVMFERRWPSPAQLLLKLSRGESMPSTVNRILKLHWRCELLQSHELRETLAHEIRRHLHTEFY